MTEKRFNELIADILYGTRKTYIHAKDELKSAITFTPEPVKYFQKRVQVPEPCREALEMGQVYYFPEFIFGKPHADRMKWDDDAADLAYLAAGLIYLTPEHATARAAAWLEIEVGE